MTAMQTAVSEVRATSRTRARTLTGKDAAAEDKVHCPPACAPRSEATAPGRSPDQACWLPAPRPAHPAAQPLSSRACHPPVTARNARWREPRRSGDPSPAPARDATAAASPRRPLTLARAVAPLARTTPWPSPRKRNKEGGKKSSHVLWRAKRRVARHVTWRRPLHWPGGPRPVGALNPKLTYELSADVLRASWCVALGTA